jgi:hypothetical protein
MLSLPVTHSVYRCRDLAKGIPDVLPFAGIRETLGKATSSMVAPLDICCTSTRRL